MRDAIRGLSSAYFAMVMATGIVSLAAFLSGMQSVALALFAINIVAFLVITALNIARVVMVPREVARDLIDHQRGPGFFTSVAACCILAVQFIVIAGDERIATALWVVGIVLWISLTYTIFTGFTVKSDKPTLGEGITGAWLLAVVATQSIAVLSAFLASHWHQPYRVGANFLALSMWLWGGMLYIWMISLIFYRYTFFRFSPGDLTPPYWINMGAMAISTLTGSILTINSPDAPFIRSLLPFVKGFTVFYWATATWWIPMLFILGFWRHVYQRYPLRYDPLYWGAVFPLGMYTVCTLRMAQALQLDFLQIISRVFVWLALAAWALTFAGFLYSLTRSARAGSSPPPSAR